MDSPTPINFRAAQATMAYGGRPATRAQFGQPGQVTQAGQPTTQPGSGSPSSPARTSVSRQADGSIIPPHARASTPDPMRIGRHQDTLSPALAAMVAGQVDSPVSRGEGFEAPQPLPQTALSSRSDVGQPPRSAVGAYAMYTRAADRIEVATGLTLGRTVDARG
jgi:hypothetical protein